MNVYSKPRKNILILSIISILILLGVMVRFSETITEYNNANEPIETFVPR